MNAYFVFKTREVKPESIGVALSNGRSTHRAMQAVDNNYAAYVDDVRNKVYNDSLHTVKGRKPGSRIECIDGEYKLV
jgi:hypothetical protein